MMFSSLEENMIYVIMHMTVLFIQLTSPFQYYHPDKNGKTTGNEAEYLEKTHCATYKTVFCCNGQPPRSRTLVVSVLLEHHEKAVKLHSSGNQAIRAKSKNNVICHLLGLRNTRVNYQQLFIELSKTFFVAITKKTRYWKLLF